MKKFSALFIHCNKNSFSAISLVRFTIILYTLALLSGCMGMMADSIAKSWVTGETYEEMAATLPQPKEGSGRLFIYRSATSTKSSLKYGIGLVKNSTLCTIDDTVYELIWEVFRYIDLPKGEHVVTCGRDVLQKRDFWTSKPYYQRGANKILVSVPNVTDVFVRVEATELPPYFQPVLVESAQGREEILKLQYQKEGSHTYCDGAISAR